MKGFSVLNPLFHKDGRPLLNTDFAHYYQRIRSKQKREALWSLGLVVLYTGAGNLAEFNLHTVWVSIRTSSTTAETIPTLHWPLLFADGRTEELAGLLGLPSEYPAAADLGRPCSWRWRRPFSRCWWRPCWRFWRPATPIPRPRCGWRSARWWRFAHHAGAGVGGDVRDGVRHRRHSRLLALALHTIGSLTKLFYESIETASNKPVRGLRGAATPLQRMRFGLWPQVKPVFLSYSFMRLELPSVDHFGAGGRGRHRRADDQH